MKTKILVPVKERYYDADEFLKRVENNRDNIESCRFIAPKLGSSDFGKFKVVFKHAELIDVKTA